ncbi:MAG: prepilin-type N-terminal cleavage/methylation domain-containing protein, partial [Gemmatimonadota bacterium]
MRRWLKWPTRALDRDGFSVIEVLVAVAVFAFAIMAMATSTNLISRQMNIARRDMRLAFALQEQMEWLLSLGYGGLTNGTYADTVAGFPMTWAVSGTNPKT